MMLIGLSGPAGVGKDTVADYLVETHGFTKFSFSDALYREVSEAFGISIEELQRRETKEKLHDKLIETRCKDAEFVKFMRSAPDENISTYVWPRSFSPRWVLQRWGTDYRRAQDPDYWVKKTALWVHAWLDVTKDDGEYHGGLVNTSRSLPQRARLHREPQRRGMAYAPQGYRRHGVRAGLRVRAWPRHPARGSRDPQQRNSRTAPHRGKPDAGQRPRHPPRTRRARLCDVQEVRLDSQSLQPGARSARSRLSSTKPSTRCRPSTRRCTATVRRRSSTTSAA